jgi:hypothetical protein
MSRKQQWGTNPTRKQWPKIWRDCHTKRVIKRKYKEDALMSKLVAEYNEEKSKEILNSNVTTSPSFLEVDDSAGTV